MRDGQQGAIRAKRTKYPTGGIVKPQLRWAPRAVHLDIPPENALRVAGADRLHPRLFRRKPTGDVRSGIPATEAVRKLVVRQNPLQKAIAESLDRIRNTGNVGS